MKANTGLTEYDIGKQVAAQQPPLSEEVFQSVMNTIRSFIDKHSNKYFMLLNREQYDFTLFNAGHKHSMDLFRIIDGLKECLQNRGKVISIDYVEDKAFEIWIKNEQDTYLYYFFPYDNGVID